MANSEINPKIQYTATGTSVFAVPFTFSKNSDLEVIVSVSGSSDVTKTLGTDYNITNTNVVFVSGSIPSTGTVTILRNQSLSQDVDLNSLDSTNPEVIEGGLDYLNNSINQLKEEINRSIKFPKSESTTTNDVLGNKESRKSKYLSFNSTGELELLTTEIAVGNLGDTVITDNLTSLGLIDVSSLADGTVAYAKGHTSDNDGGQGFWYLDVASAGTTNNGTLIDANGTGQWIRIREAGIINVKHFGATGNNSTNDSSAITSAISALDSSNKVLYFPTGVYLMNTNFAFSSDLSDLQIRGDDATIKRSDATTSDIFRFQATFYGLSISGLTFDQTGTTGSLQNSVVIGGSGYSASNVTIQNCKFLGGVCVGIKATGNVTGITVTNCFANSLSTFVTVADDGTDTPRDVIISNNIIREAQSNLYNAINISFTASGPSTYSKDWLTSITVSNNVIVGEFSFGIYLNGEGKNCLISNNSIFETDNSIYCRYLSDSSIIGNLTTSTVLITQCNQMKIAENKVENYYSGSRVIDGGQGILSNSNVNSQFHDNDVYDFQKGIYDLFGNKNTYKNNNFINYSGSFTSGDGKQMEIYFSDSISVIGNSFNSQCPTPEASLTAVEIRALNSDITNFIINNNTVTGEYADFIDFDIDGTGNIGKTMVNNNVFNDCYFSVGALTNGNSAQVTNLIINDNVSLIASGSNYRLNGYSGSDVSGITSSFTANLDNTTYFVSQSGASSTITLPTFSNHIGQKFKFISTSTAAEHSSSVATFGGNTILKHGVLQAAQVEATPIGWIKA